VLAVASSRVGLTGLTATDLGVWVGQGSTQALINWTTFTEVVESGDVILFTGSSEVDRLIAAGTGGPYCHATAVYKPADGTALLLWESDTMKMASDPLDPENNYLGAQCNELIDAVNFMVAYKCTPFFRKLTYTRPPGFDDQFKQVILEYDGKVAFGSILDMFKNYVIGHYLGIAGPPSEVFCAELLAMTYVKLGLMDPIHPPNFYSPSSFSRYTNEVTLVKGSFEPEIEFDVTTIPPSSVPHPS
jgi:hypothetical protein